MSREKKNGRKSANSTRELMRVREITDHSLVTTDSELVFYVIKPTNISVLSDATVGQHVYALLNVLKGVPQLEFLCLNSRENFEDNKHYLSARLEAENVPQLRKLLALDAGHLDQMQVQMATAREFIIAVRLSTEKDASAFQQYSSIESTLKNHGFRARRADSDDIKRILAVYFEQYTHFRENNLYSTSKGFANTVINKEDSQTVRFGCPLCG